VGGPIKCVARGPSWVVVDKPAGLLSVPGRGPGKADCAVARVAALIHEADGPMVVHRLDMDTSGLLLVALSAGAQRALSRQFRDRMVLKRYVGVVEGAPGARAGVVRLRQRLNVDRRPVQIVDETFGKLAVTRWRRIDPHPRDAAHERTRIEFGPVTGRSHQIRLAASSPAPAGLGCPIVGDDLYGSGRTPGERLMLAAVALTFDDPDTGRRVRVRIAPPF